MALLKLGTTITDIRGTIGGMVFSKNAAGNYARVWTRPINPNSLKQQTERLYVAWQSQAWADLTTAQRADWDTYAAALPQKKTNSMGEDYYASGFNWFVALNQHQLQAGKTALTDAPTASRPGPAPLNDGSITIGPPAEALLKFNATTFDPDRLVVVFASKRSRQTNNTPPGRHMLNIYAYPGAAATQIDMTTEVEALFGAIQEGYRYYFEVAQQDPDDGQRSSLTRDVIDEA